MKSLQSQTIELYSKQLRTPMFNQYTDVVRQLDQNQSYEDFLIALMKLELDSRQESTRRRKIKYAGFPYIKTMDELDYNRFEHMNAAFINELASCGFVSKRQNIVMIGNPGTGKTHTAIGLGIKACEQGYRVLYTTIPYLVTELKESNNKQKLRTYQKRFEKYDLILADELGYISFDREAADLLFTVLSLRASQKSTIITSNLTFERWDEIFGDAAITSAIVDRLTYKAYLIDMEGDSYRLRETLRSNGSDFESVVK